MNEIRKSEIDPTESLPRTFQIAFILGAGFWGLFVFLLDKILAPFPRENYQDRK